MKKNILSARHLARIAVVQALYVKEQTSTPISQIADTFVVENFSQTLEFLDTHKVLVDTAFFKTLIDDIETHIETINTQIQFYLQETWKLERLSSVVRCVLQSAVGELMTQPLVPTPVILNEYIELGRLFVDERDVKFINGILDNVAKNVRQTS